MIQGAVAGLASGGLYALIAVCLTLITRLVGVLNFAQVAVAIFGALTGARLESLGWPTWAAFVVGVVVGAILSAVLGLILATWLPDSNVNTRSAVTVAALLFIIALSFIVFGTLPLNFNPILGGAAFSIGGVVISQITLTLTIVAIAVAVAVRIVLSRTTIGIKLRALSERPTTAELIGIPSRPLSVGVWVVTGVIATVAVSLIAPTQSTNAVTISLLIVPCAAAALAGGFRRLDFAVIGGLVLGMLDGILAQSDTLVLLRYFAPFLIIVAILLWRQRNEVWDAAR